MTSINNRPGFRVDNFFVSFPDDQEIITEDPNGNMFINVDIFKLDNDNRIRVKQEEVTEELQIKISAYINEMILQAIEEEEKKNVKN